MPTNNNDLDPRIPVFPPTESESSDFYTAVDSYVPRDIKDEVAANTPIKTPLIKGWTDDINLILNNISEFKSTGMSAYAIRQYLLGSLNVLTNLMNERDGALVDYTDKLSDLLDKILKQLRSVFSGDNILHAGDAFTNVDLNDPATYGSGVYRVVKSGTDAGGHAVYDLVVSDGESAGTYTLSGDLPGVADATGFLVVHDISDHTVDETGKVRIRQILYPDGESSDTSSIEPWTRVIYQDDEGAITTSQWTKLGGSSTSQRSMVFMYYLDCPYLGQFDADSSKWGSATGSDGHLIPYIDNDEPVKYGNKDNVIYDPQHSASDRNYQPNADGVVTKCNLAHNDLTVKVDRSVCVVLPDPATMALGVTVVFEITPEINISRISTDDGDPRFVDLYVTSEVAGSSDFYHFTNLQNDIRYIVLQTTLTGDNSENSAVKKWVYISC